MCNLRESLKTLSVLSFYKMEILSYFMDFFLQTNVKIQSRCSVKSVIYVKEIWMVEYHKVLLHLS